jgi:hypothetical protein
MRMKRVRSTSQAHVERGGGGQGPRARRRLLLILLALAIGFALRTARATEWSTLYTAHQVRDRLSTPEGRAEAIEFMRRMGVTKVYLETFRDGYQADPNTLKASRDYFRQAGLKVAGCVATTGLGKPSTGWKVVACYTNRANRERLASIFRFTAGLFDEIIIDDFFFTDCECSECAAARGRMSWRQYREKLMLEVSRDTVLGPAREANPRVQITLKYPQWYDKFQDRGYSVAEESALYDHIWTGTELRDPSSDEWGHKSQYEAFFLLRWLSDVAGTKNGGGWFDSYGTDPTFYLDQAYMTVVAGAPEVFLFNAGDLDGPRYRAQAEALAAHRTEIESLAKLTGAWQGIPACKPPSSDPGDEPYIFDQIGMLAVPLVPVAHFPVGARAALFTVHSLEDADFVPKLVSFLGAGGTALVSEGLAHRLEGDLRLPSSQPLDLGKGTYIKALAEAAGKVVVFSDALPKLAYVDSHNEVAQLTPDLRAALAELRRTVGEFTATSLDAPPRLAVFPMADRVAVANFTEMPVSCRLTGRWTGSGGGAAKGQSLFATAGASVAEDGQTLRLPPHGWMVVE